MKHTGTTPDLSILFEDEHLLVVNKPHDLLSQKDRTGDPDVQSLCKQYLRKSYGEQGKIYLGLVHRLDRPVAGLMMLAKTSKAAEHLSKQIRDRTVRKSYFAVVHGSPNANGLLTHYLVKNSDTNIVHTSDENDPKAREAVLTYQKREETNGLSLIEVHLQTGRPHQIRVQFSDQGYPVWGDYKYGIQNKPDGRTIALRAVKLSFAHPETKEEIQLQLPPPYTEPWSFFDIKKYFDQSPGNS